MAKIKLSKENYAGLLQSERLLHDILPEMDKAEECGIECQEFRRVHAEAMQRIEAMKRNYGPNSG